MRKRFEEIWPGMATVTLGLSFFWALFLVVNFRAFTEFVEQIAHSVPYLGWFLAGPLFGLLALLPAIGGPIAASVGGNRLAFIRIFIVNLFIALFFIAGLFAPFYKDQWFYLDLILAGQIMTVGLAVPASVPWNCALLGCFALVWLMNTLWYIFDLLVVVYLVASGILIITKTWKVERAS